MTYRVRFTLNAESDLLRLYQFLLARDAKDWALAERALEATKSAIRNLEFSPFSCRKASANTPFLREQIIPFGASGYVALFEIDDDRTVTILTIRHHLEDDYY